MTEHSRSGIGITRTGRSTVRISMHHHDPDRLDGDFVLLNRRRAIRAAIGLLRAALRRW